jgi:hypothetical protein
MTLERAGFRRQAGAARSIEVLVDPKLLLARLSELPHHLQRRAATIARDQGLEAYFTALVGQMTEIAPNPEMGRQAH